MRIVRTIAAEDCPNGIDCAKIHRLDDGNLLVRGYRPDGRAVDAHSLRDHEHAVRVPAEVYAAAHAVLGETLERSVLAHLPGGDVLIRGTVITDTERAGLALPDHEDAVRVPEPELEGAPA